jgi:excisionase family DNA binding protein
MATNEPVVQTNPAPAGYVTVREVGARLRLGRTATYRLVHSGELPAVRVGRSFRVIEDDVNEYLRNSFYSAG